MKQYYEAIIIIRVYMKSSEVNQPCFLRQTATMSTSFFLMAHLKQRLYICGKN